MPRSADVVLNSGETDIVKTELTQWATMIDSNAELGDVFDNPAIPHAQKEKILESLIATVRPSKTVGNFLRILLKKWAAFCDRCDQRAVRCRARRAKRSGDGRGHFGTRAAGK